jgi:hypothetical protein
MPEGRVRKGLDTESNGGDGDHGGQPSDALALSSVTSVSSVQIRIKLFCAGHSPVLAKVFAISCRSGASRDQQRGVGARTKLPGAGSARSFGAAANSTPQSVGRNEARVGFALPGDLNPAIGRRARGACRIRVAWRPQSYNRAAGGSARVGFGPPGDLNPAIGRRRRGPCRIRAAGEGSGAAKPPRLARPPPRLRLFPGGTMKMGSSRAGPKHGKPLRPEDS